MEADDFHVSLPPLASFVEAIFLSYRRRRIASADRRANPDIAN
jgi:hypothetical protein